MGSGQYPHGGDQGSFITESIFAVSAAQRDGRRKLLAKVQERPSILVVPHNYRLCDVMHHDHHETDGCDDPWPVFHRHWTRSRCGVVTCTEAIGGHKYLGQGSPTGPAASTLRAGAF